MSNWNVLEETGNLPESGKPFEFIGKGGSLNYGVVRGTVEINSEIVTGSTKAVYLDSVVCWRYMDLPESVVSKLKSGKRKGIQFSYVYR